MLGEVHAEAAAECVEGEFSEAEPVAGGIGWLLSCLVEVDGVDEPAGGVVVEGGGVTAVYGQIAICAL